MHPLFAAFIAITVAELAFYLALPRLLALRGIEATRHGIFGLTMVFETPDEDGTPVRMLNVNGVFQSASYVSDELWNELACVYHRQMVGQIDGLGRAHSVLVIGGGGYSLPKYLVTHTRHMHVCVVEIDPNVTELARRRFFLGRAEALAGNRLELVCADGVEWLRACDRRFDVIINDAFSAGRPLATLATVDGAHLVADRLTPGGIYLANLRCPLLGRRSRPMYATKQAYGEVFGRVSIVPENPDEPRRLANNVLVAVK